MSGKEDTVKIAVVGVGGAGCNTVRMMKEEADNNEHSVFRDSNVKILAANTDAQVLDQLENMERIQLGPKLTKGQGAGGNPECGKDAAIESQMDIISAIEGSDMVFVTAGMGGGTGTGASHIIANSARKTDALTVGIVTKPFRYEGKKKMRIADAGIEELRKSVDALLILHNDILFETAKGESTQKMLKKSSEILIYTVRSISELVTNPGVVNVDFSDVKNTMKGMGVAVFAYGKATGEHAPLNAVKDALNNPLLKNYTINGTKKMLLYVCGVTESSEFEEAMAYLDDLRDEDADFKFGIFEDVENQTDVSVFIIAEAHEKDISDSKECKKANDNQGTIFEAARNEGRVSEDVVIEVQKLTDENSDKVVAATAAKNVSAEPPSLEVKDTKPFSFKDETVAFIPESIDIDQNDKSIPAVFRKLSKEEKEKMQVSLTEYIYK